MLSHESYINLIVQAAVPPTLVKLRGHFMTAEERDYCSKMQTQSYNDQINRNQNNDQNNDVNILKFNISKIRDNITSLDKTHNCNVLLFKEALIIERHKPSLNSGLYASKDF